VLVIPTVISPAIISMVAAPAMFLWRSSSFSCGAPFMFRTLLQLVVLRCAFARSKAMNVRVGMGIFTAIIPVPPPARIVDEHGAPVPVKPAVTPTPGSEKSSNRHTKAETYRAADKKTGARGIENDSRVIIRNHDVAGICRHDGDVWSSANYNLAVAS
jgi:hypothetical protein